jgi:CheY-like chemotaxis protein
MRLVLIGRDTERMAALRKKCQIFDQLKFYPTDHALLSAYRKDLPDVVIFDMREDRAQLLLTFSKLQDRFPRLARLACLVIGKAAAGDLKAIQAERSDFLHLPNVEYFPSEITEEALFSRITDLSLKSLKREQVVDYETPVRLGEAPSKRMPPQAPQIILQMKDSQKATEIAALLEDMGAKAVHLLSVEEVDPTCLKAFLLEPGADGFSESEVSSWLAINSKLRVIQLPIDSVDELKDLHPLSTLLLRCGPSAQEIAIALRRWIPGPAHQAQEPDSVIVVEDEHNFRELLAHFLLLKGFDVRQAEDGQTALELFQVRPADFIVTDVYMPRLNGLKLLSVLKEKNPNLPFLIMTGYQSAAEVARALPYSHVEFMSKPFRLSEFQKCIAGLLEENEL